MHRRHIVYAVRHMVNGAGTNLKVGDTGPERKWGAQKNFFGRAPPLFGCKSTISRFGERFRGDQYSFVSFSFAVLLTMPPCPAICKSGGTCPRAPWSRRHCTWLLFIIINRKAWIRRPLWDTITWDKEGVRYNVSVPDMSLELDKWWTGEAELVIVARWHRLHGAPIAGCIAV